MYRVICKYIYLYNFHLFADPFVKVYLSGGGKRLKKKKTSARKNTNSPVWNEAVAFSISADSLANAALEVWKLLH